MLPTKLESLFTGQADTTIISQPAEVHLGSLVRCRAGARLVSQQAAVYATLDQLRTWW